MQRTREIGSSKRSAGLTRGCLAIVFASLLLVSCSHRWERLGTYVNPGGETATQVLAEFKDDRVLFAIAWTKKLGESGGGRSIGKSLFGGLNSIDGRPIDLRPDLQAIYVLQQDYTLKPLALSEREHAALFEQLSQPKFNPEESKVWGSKVAPHLQAARLGGKGPD